MKSDTQEILQQVLFWTYFHIQTSDWENGSTEAVLYVYNISIVLTLSRNTSYNKLKKCRTVLSVLKVISKSPTVLH